jgi:hypothetical protein
MNEAESLLKLEARDLPALRPVGLDDLHQKVLKNLHLEIGSDGFLFLLSPNGTVLSPAPSALINELTGKKEALLGYLKESIVQNLAVYSVLLDVNSYFIEQNNFLVLARLREKDVEGRRYEIQFYTHAPMELLSHYQDKIYIGRDFLDLYNFRRKYYGVRESILSLREQSDRLVERAAEKLKRPLEYKAFFQEIRESVGELDSESAAVLDSLPPDLDEAKLGESDLIEINAQYRAINHFLIELNEEVTEFENLLRFRMEIDFVRYVTKYKKDLTNLILFFNIKINGPLGQRIVHFRSKPGA